MPCTYPKNIEVYRKVVTKFCPVHFLLENVRCTRPRDPLVCCWEVDYVSDDSELRNEGPGLETLVKLILDEQPKMYVFLDKGLVRKKSITIMSEVICECASPVFEGSDLKDPHI